MSSPNLSQSIRFTGRIMAPLASSTTPDETPPIVIIDNEAYTMPEETVASFVKMAGIYLLAALRLIVRSIIAFVSPISPIA